ncbi:hypothetical protein, partial [Escherichia coli]|uniref:hypothetical protein n=1 Tax=Escherichia coli TaxID=562 RepID=UPI001CDAF0DF
TSGEKRVFLVILFTSFSGSLVSRIPGAVHNVIAVLVCSAGLIHQHSLNYSLLNREIRKHSKT